MILEENTLSSNIALGKPMDMGWLSALGSDAVGWLKKGAASAWNYIKKIGQGARAVVDSIRQGNFGKIFKQWAKEDPLAATAGVVAAGLAGGVILITGGAAVAWVTGGLGAMAGSLGLFGAGAATVSLGGVISGTLNQAETVYSMDLQTSDKEIMKQMEDAVNGLYNPAGEFLGRSMAGFLVGGLATKPKVEVNIKRTALAMYIRPEIAEDILDNVSQFAKTALDAVRKISIMYMLMKGREGIKSMWAEMPPGVRKQFPKLDEAIATWGDEDKEPWSFEKKVNESIEKIDDKRLRDAAEGFLSGFWNQFRDGIEKVYV
jgi:hypothetical protein